LNSYQTEKLYWPYVKDLASESGLYYIFNDMRGLLVNSHVSLGVHPSKPSEQPPVGLLGADYTIDYGHYRFAHIYSSGNWNPDLDAPLERPGLDVQAGDYLLAVNGRTLTASDNVFSFFKGTAGKQTILKVGSSPNGAGAHTILVVPIRSEQSLREQAWVAENLRQVNKLGHGKIAYVYLPSTSSAGYKNFNRYFFSQIYKQAVIIDERFNSGGFAADYIIDYLRRRLMNYWYTRHGHTFTTPEGAIFGPKAMLINAYSQSGGDALPWYFKEMHLGPLIGMRTWGGLNAVSNAPPLIDGTTVGEPHVAIYGPKGHWVVENQGNTPDFKVPLTPKAWRNGHDPQLEKAVSVVLKMLKKHPPKHVKHPPFRNYHQHPAVSPSGGGRR
jgi:tricorn protease